MASYKVAELEGALLDAAVAKATCDVWAHSGDYRADMTQAPYSTDWAHGGPIIERERIDLRWNGEAWVADGWRSNPHEDGASDFSAKTPLIAAMRAYVASKFGVEVELP